MLWEVGQTMIKEIVLTVVRSVLKEDKRLVFAYIYGSYVAEGSFRDVDIGVYLKNKNENPLVVSSDLKTDLSRQAKKNGLNLIADDFDVRIINDAPFTFLKKVFKEGLLVIDHDPELRTDMIEYVSRKYRECAGLLAEAALE